MTYIGSNLLTSLKVKRNQFPNILNGLPNHQFAYIVFGNLSVLRNDSLYTFCSRSDDG